MRWRPFGPRGPSWWELTVQALSSTEGGYDRLAPRFEATPFRTPDAILERALEEEPPVDAALDLCCGTGAALAALAPKAERLVGLDASAGMLDEARRRLPERAELVRGDALHPPAELHGAFDVVTCFGAFGHIRPSEEPTLVAAVHRLLKPGGRFVFATTDPDRGRPLGRALARAFNGAMHVRNALWRPPFVMFYLTFERPRARALLEDAGFAVHADHPFEAPYDRLARLVATKGDGRPTREGVFTVRSENSPMIPTDERGTQSAGSAPMRRRLSAPLLFSFVLAVPLLQGSGWGASGCGSYDPEPSKTEGRWELVAPGPGTLEWYGEGGSYLQATPNAAGDYVAETAGHAVVLPCSDEGFLCPLEVWLPEEDGLWHFGERANELPQRFRHYRSCEGDGCPGEIRSSRVDASIDGVSFTPVSDLADDCMELYGDFTFDELDVENDRYTHVSGTLRMTYRLSCLRTVEGERVDHPDASSWYEITQPIEGWYVGG